MFNATWPLSRLTVDRSSARISGLCPRVAIAKADVTTVSAVKGLLGTGIRFGSSDGRYDGVLFWTFDPVQVLQGFARFGWLIKPYR
jgi:hypothetical protein